MIKIKQVSTVEAVARYFDDPKLDGHERNGTWIGRGCSALGFPERQVISKEEFISALNGWSPTKKCLFQKEHPNRRAAWEIMFAPDKTISIAALCLSEEIKKSIVVAFNQAVTDTIAIADHLAVSQIRRGRPAKTIIRPAHGLVAAMFTHEASRWNDPHCHCHAVTLNGVVSYDHGGGVALEPKPIFQQKHALDKIFNHILWGRLADLGFNATKSPQGNAILPVPKWLCDLLSKAHAAILQKFDEVKHSLAKLNVSAAALKNIINDRIRPAKIEHPDYLKILTDDLKHTIIAAIRRDSPTPLQKIIPPISLAAAIQKKAGHFTSIKFPATKITALSKLIQERDDIPIGETLQSAVKIAFSRSLFTHSVFNRPRITAETPQETQRRRWKTIWDAEDAKRRREREKHARIRRERLASTAIAPLIPSDNMRI